MDTEHTHAIEWLQRKCALLHDRQGEVWNELSAIAASGMATGHAEKLFAHFLETEIELFRATGLKAHLQGEGDSLRFDDEQIDTLFERVHAEEAAIIDRFDAWKQAKAPPLSIIDFTPWRQAMAAYFRASPGEI